MSSPRKCSTPNAARDNATPVPACSAMPKTTGAADSSKWLLSKSWKLQSQ